jgi:hypothetical protein
MVLEETVPILMEMLLELHLVRTWVSIAKIIEKLILLLEILHAHDGSMDLEVCVL